MDDIASLRYEIERLQGYVSLVQEDHARRSGEPLAASNWRESAYVEAVASIVSCLEPSVLKKKGFPSLESCIRWEENRLNQL